MAHSTRSSASSIRSVHMGNHPLSRRSPTSRRRRTGWRSASPQLLRMGRQAGARCIGKIHAQLQSQSPEATRGYVHCRMASLYDVVLWRDLLDNSQNALDRLTCPRYIHSSLTFQCRGLQPRESTRHCAEQKVRRYARALVEARQGEVRVVSRDGTEWYFSRGGTGAIVLMNSKIALAL
jgi:hypothetical protein